MTIIGESEQNLNTAGDSDERSGNPRFDGADDVKDAIEVVRSLRERLTPEARDRFDTNQEKFRPWEEKMADVLGVIAKELGEVQFSMQTDLNDVIFELNGDRVVVTRHLAGARVGSMDPISVSGYTMSRADYEKPWFQRLLAQVPLDIIVEG